MHCALPNHPDAELATDIGIGNVLHLGSHTNSLACHLRQLVDETSIGDPSIREHSLPWFTVLLAEGLSRYCFRKTLSVAPDPVQI